MSDNEPIPPNSVNMTEREMDYVAKAIKSGLVSGTGGEFIGRFEQKCAEFCGTRYGVACSSGTTALQLAVRAAGIGPGDEVILGTFTNIPTALSVIYNGAKPVLVDSRRDTWCTDEAAIADKITSRTKAIMPIHIYGHPAKMDTIMALAKEHNLTVIEDAAEAYGATFEGRRIGGIGQMACLSFLGGKVITSAEGGMVMTSSEQLADKMRSLRSHAFGTGVNRYMHVDTGFNFRLSNLQAAMGLAQAERAEELIELRRTIASWYTSELKGVPGITLPVEMPWAKNVYYVYGVLFNEAFGMSRNEVYDELGKMGIGTGPFFVPMHMQHVFHKMGLFKGESYPVSEYLAEHGLCLPSGTLLTKEKVRRVCDALKEFSRK